MQFAEMIRKAYRARWNRALREAKAISSRMEAADADKVTGDDLAALRDLTESLTQCIHEYNAYRNAYRAAANGTGRASGGRG